MAEITGLDVNFIYRKLPLAIGRQYELIFFAKREIACQHQTSSGTALDKVIT